MLKVMAKMGISRCKVVQGRTDFRGGGPGGDDVIDRCFAGTASRIQGVDRSRPGRRMLRRHDVGLSPARGPVRRRATALPNPGEFHWRAEGERHMWDPPSIADIQVAARTNDH